ncbi:hypothetical protein BDW22DRAFT_1345062 [Trametopsis cervina]|nr:hypothetical protein BDW22DRAFT_1345062 [Trametopsis cervina]
MAVKAHNAGHAQLCLLPRGQDAVGITGPCSFSRVSAHNYKHEIRPNRLRASRNQLSDFLHPAESSVTLRSNGVRTYKVPKMHDRNADQAPTFIGVSASARCGYEQILTLVLPGGKNNLDYAYRGEVAEKSVWVPRVHTFPCIAVNVCSRGLSMIGMLAEGLDFPPQMRCCERTSATIKATISVQSRASNLCRDTRSSRFWTNYSDKRCTAQPSSSLWDVWIAGISPNTSFSMESSEELNSSHPNKLYRLPGIQWTASPTVSGWHSLSREPMQAGHWGSSGRGSRIRTMIHPFCFLGNEGPSSLLALRRVNEEFMMEQQTQRGDAI